MSETSGHSIESMLLAILPKGPALLSLFSSSAIIIKTCHKTANDRSVLDRIMIGLSVTDIIISINYFLGTWLIPSGTVGDFGPIYGAFGTDATCKISGFFTQYAVASTMYNASLATYFLLTIHYNKHERDLEKVERWFHIIPTSFAIFTSVFALIFDMYQSVEWLCWIRPDPVVTPVQQVFKLIQWLFLFAPIWICLFYQSGVMFFLFRKIRMFEKKMQQYTFSGVRHQIANRSLIIDDGNVPNAIRLSKNDGISTLSKSGINDNLCQVKEKENEESDVENQSSLKASGIVNENDEVLVISVNHNEERSEHDDNESNFKQLELEKDSLLPESMVTPLGSDKNDDDNEKQSDSVNETANKKKHRFSLNVGQTEKRDESKPSRLSASFRKILHGRRNSLSSMDTAERERMLRQFEKSRLIATQGVLYVCAFYVTWLFPTIMRITQFFGKTYYGIQILDSSLLPMQGFFNCLIYLRPRYLSYRNAHPDEGFWRILWTITFAQG